MTLKDLARAAERKLSQHEFDMSFGLFRNHEKFFEGYELRLDKTQGRKGARYVQVYEGTWYAPNMSFAHHLFLRFTYLLLSVASFLCFLKGDSFGGRWQDVWYFVFPKLFAILSYIWIISAVVYYGTRGRRMTVYEYNSSTSMVRRSSLFATLSLILECLVWVVVALIRGLPKSEYRGLLFIMGAAAFALMIRILENRVNYLVADDKKEN